MLDGGSRSPYRQGCRILIEMARAIFSCSWRIRERYVVHNRFAARGALEVHDVVAVTMRDFEDWLARHNAFGNALI